MSAAPLTVGWLGTRVMGAPMARNVAREGVAVRAWNRTPERARPLEQDGVTVVERAEDAVGGADVAVTMLSDADATLAVAETILPALSPDAIWLQAGTIGIEAIDRCAELAQRLGVALVDAPVLGTAKPAQDGTLVVLASGPDDAVERCSPIFRAIGQRTVRLGPAGQGTRLKLAVNVWVLALDVYEHAYARDFGATPDGRKEYVEAFFRNLDWDHVNRQLVQAEAARQGASAVNLEEEVPTAS